MTPELREAAERYRNSDGFACSEPEEALPHLLVLAAAWIVEHEEDEDPGEEAYREHTQPY